MRWGKPFVNRDRIVAGVTLVEILAVLGILAILGTLSVGVLQRMLGVGDRAASSANMRALYVGFDAYTQDKGHWPQQPFNNITQAKDYEEWWIDTMKPYDISKSVWICPGIKRLGNIKADGTAPRIHYNPTDFDKEPRTPYKWPTMPWFIQLTNVFGRGALIMFPDGSIRDMDDVLVEFGQ